MEKTIQLPVYKVVPWNSTSEGITYALVDIVSYMKNPSDGACVITKGTEDALSGMAEKLNKRIDLINSMKHPLPPHTITLDEESWKRLERMSEGAREYTKNHPIAHLLKHLTQSLEGMSIEAEMEKALAAEASPEGVVKNLIEAAFKSAIIKGMVKL